jgi:nitrate/TMAO reductase-like tetraheme cytochrome c subunit
MRIAWLSPLVYLADNWLSRIGMAAVTTATVLWIFLLPVTVRGEMENPYIGILSYLALPALFFAGLLLIPLGIAWKRKRARRSGSYPAPFGPLAWANREVRRLVALVGLLTAANIVIGSQFTYGAVTYMDSVAFCGKACHTVMQPEYTAYQNSPHSRVECVKCHIGPGVPGFVQSKLSGTRQVFAVLFNNYPRPIPAPVHNLRPARETCETCHWPRKYFSDRVRIFPKYAEDEGNTASKTVLLLKIGGGNNGIGIHGTHLGPGVSIRYAHSDEQRQTIPWIEYSGPGRRTVYAADGSPATAGKLPVREMDCMDCHNRPAHSYDMPDRAIDNAMFANLISPLLPNARKKGLELLKASYGTREAAAARIPQAFEEFYQQNYPADYGQHQKEVTGGAKELLAIWDRNIFPDMNVTWGKYPVNIGHTDFPGCFRCHDDAHASTDGRKVTQDCNACHSVLAVEEAAPKILQDLGMTPAENTAPVATSGKK